LDNWKLGITFEYTARDTLQWNHLAELKFVVLGNRCRALLYRANVPRADRYLLWREAFQTAALLDGLIIIKIDGVSKTRCEHLFGKNPEFSKHLRFWGEAGMVKIKTKTTPELSGRGVQCMMIGYALDHAGDTYRMWNK
jgi:hypothetical protein